MFKHIVAPKITKIKRKVIHNKRFYVTPEGKEYMSITTNLGMIEKPWLEEWRQSLGKEKADKETQRCAERGTAIHEMAERYLKNEKDFTKDHLPEHIKGFNQLKMRLKSINNIKAQEVSLWSDTLETAGAVDCIAEYDDVPSIIDFKTSNNTKTKDMVFDYFLQLTAYSLMWYERTGELIEDIVIVMYVERNAFPIIYKEKIHKYIKPLSKRLKEGEKLWLEYLTNQTQNDSSELNIPHPNK